MMHLPYRRAAAAVAPTRLIVNGRRVVLIRVKSPGKVAAVAAALRSHIARLLQEWD